MDSAESFNASPLIEYQERLSLLRPSRCGTPVWWSFEDTCDSQIDNLVDLSVRAFDGISFSPEGYDYFIERLHDRVLSQCEGTA